MSKEQTPRTAEELRKSVISQINETVDKHQIIGAFEIAQDILPIMEQYAQYREKKALEDINQELEHLRLTYERGRSGYSVKKDLDNKTNGWYQGIRFCLDRITKRIARGNY